ncbi:MAG: hypothetical protein NT026_02505, partial [Candidatus Staskawiczbacteria bacterium]|nr:hypothetical protein [Candidatus Staskawiczbacteria bacterium]
DELEYFLLHHPKNLESKKVRGEEELFGWLAENLEKKYGRKPMVELNEKGIIVPINAEEE